MRLRCRAWSKRSRSAWSSDQSQAVLWLENALDCLEILFIAIGASDFLSKVRGWQSILAAGEKINAHRLAFGGKAGEITLPVRNRHELTESQLAWIDACYTRAVSIASGAAWFLWLHDRLIVKEPFVIAERKLEIRAMSCARCHAVLVERKDVLEAAAAAWGRFRVRPLIEAGNGQEAVEESLTCSLCAPFILTIEAIIREKGVERVQDKAGACPACGSAEIRYSPITLS